MSQKRNAIYDQDLASNKTYDLTAQADESSADVTADLTKPASATRSQAAAQLGSSIHIENVLADATVQRRALRLALAIVLGRDSGFLARRK